MMMMMLVVVMVVVSHLVNTTHDNLQLTGCHWLTAPHYNLASLLLSSPTTDNVGVVEGGGWRYHQASPDATTPGTADDRPQT